MDITLNLGARYSTTKTFKTKEDVVKWALSEHGEWTKLSSQNSYVMQVMKALEFLIKNVPNAPDIQKEAKDTKFNQWLARFRGAYSGQQVLLTTDMLEFQFLKQSNASFPVSLPPIMSYFATNKIDPPTTKSTLIAARLIGNFLLPKDKASLAPNRAAFTKLENKFKTRIKELETKLAEAEQKTADYIQAEEDKSAATLVNVAESAEKRIQLKMGLQAAATSNILSKMESAINDVETKAQAAIEQINDTDKRFNTDLSLKPAYKYWSRKSVNHSKKATGILWGIIAAGALIFIALGFLLYRLLETDSTFGNFGETRTFLILTVALALTTMLFWAARIATRLYLGNVHLANDATERATLIHTYLALNVRDKASDDDRALVLGTVFRPSTDGVVKDDAAPIISPASILAARGTK